jgi:molybdopterin-binding protein
MKQHNARNDLPATVVGIKRGAVMAQVDVVLKGTNYRMSSVMTMDSLEAMDLKDGDTVEVKIAKVGHLVKYQK